MGKKSRSKGKVEEKMMVLCPKCGGKEFEMGCKGKLVRINVQPVKVSGETLYQYEVITIGINSPAMLVCTCTTCETEIAL